VITPRCWSNFQSKFQSKCAPIYATLVIAFLETKLYEKFEEKFGVTNKTRLEKEWLRYLDDCFIYWDVNICNENELHNMLNDLHPNIKFTMEANSSRMNFLDIQLLVAQDKIITDIYFKQTDTRNYVHSKSCHPKHTLKNIPFNLARRLCTIIDERTTLEKRLEEPQGTLLHLDYPINLIKKGIEKAKNIPQQTLRSNIEKENTVDLLTFVSTNNPRNPNMFSIIKESLLILKTSTRMNEAMKNMKLIPSKRQAPNLKRILTRAKFGSPSKEKTKVTQCKDPRCHTCKEILVGNQVELGSKNNKKTFNIKTNMDCGVRDFIYVIICNGCNENYIGESGDSLRHRAAVHRNQILLEHNRKLFVSNHIYHCAKDKIPMFKICPFYKLQCEDEIFRKEKEEYFIQKYKPSLNRYQ